jgi:hypothetical protein
MCNEELIDHSNFICLLRERFPAIADSITPEDMELEHIVMLSISNFTADAIDAEDWQLVSAHFEFIDEVFSTANSALQNAVIVSYLENILLLERGSKHQHARLLLPERLENALFGLESHFDNRLAFALRPSDIGREPAILAVWNQTDDWFRDRAQIDRIRSVIGQRIEDDRLQEECRYLNRLCWHFSMRYQEVSYCELLKYVSAKKMSILNNLFDRIATKDNTAIDMWIQWCERSLPIVEDKSWQAARDRMEILDERELPDIDRHSD